MPTYPPHLVSYLAGGARRILFVAAVAVLLAMTAFATADPFIYLFLIVLFGMFVALPVCAIAAGILLWPAGRRSRVGMNIVWAAVAVVCVTFVQVPGFAAVEMKTRMQVASARFECEQIAERLFTFRQSHGTFPQDIHTVADIRVFQPSLFDPDLRYETDGQSFTLTFAEPTGYLPMMHTYSSETKQWQRWD